MSGIRINRRINVEEHSEVYVVVKDGRMLEIVLGVSCKVVC